MNSIVGFCISTDLDVAASSRRDAALTRLLAHFPWLRSHRVRVGKTDVWTWGHGRPEERVVRAADGSTVIFAGSPAGKVGPPALLDAANSACGDATFRIPWNGRIDVVRVSDSGRAWTLWNDWGGSLPVYHAAVGGGTIASTVEPGVVAAAGFSAADFSLPSLMSLVLNGHYLGDATLYRGMKVVPPDCRADWRAGQFACSRQWSVRPGAERWHRGWDELALEMRDLFREAIREGLEGAAAWTVPLSGGLDSRLIAAVGRELGHDLQAVTYGQRGWDDALHARSVARALRVPWRQVDLGEDYLAKYTRLWADWFGSAMHFHGMYQVSFLKEIAPLARPIATGFIGDPLAGAQTAIMMQPVAATALDRMLAKSRMWPPAEAAALFRAGGEDAFAAVKEELQRQYDEVPGEAYQKIWFLFWWNHVFGFSSYQPTMYDYWLGVATPYLNVDCGRFTLSLPRAALDGRRLQADVMRRYYPTLARIPGTYGQWPYLLTGRYILKHRLATMLPRGLKVGPLREFSPAPNTADQQCIRDGGAAAVWPLREAWDRLAGYFDMDRVEGAIRAAGEGDLAAVCKLESLQPIAYRLLGQES